MGRLSRPRVLDMRRCEDRGLALLCDGSADTRQHCVMGKQKQKPKPLTLEFAQMNFGEGCHPREMAERTRLKAQLCGACTVV